MVSKTYCDICGAEIPPPEIVYDTVMKKKENGVQVFHTTKLNLDDGFGNRFMP